MFNMTNLSKAGHAGRNSFKDVIVKGEVQVKCNAEGFDDCYEREFFPHWRETSGSSERSWRLPLTYHAWALSYVDSEFPRDRYFKLEIALPQEIWSLISSTWLSDWQYLKTDGRSFTYRLKRRGPKRLPCGTLLSTGSSGSDNSLLIRTTLHVWDK